jgi:hypothetical protein
MRGERDWEMRPEYDFSGGVRGRHAARMTEREKEELLRRAAVQDVQTWIGYALLQVQSLEAALFTFLVLAHDHSPEQAVAKAAALLDARGPDRLRQVVEDLRNRGLADEELDARFRRVVDERNWLVHRSGYEGQAPLAAAEKTRLLLRRLERISDEARALRTEIDALIEQHLAQGGLSPNEIDRRTGETKDLWLAAA